MRKSLAIEDIDLHGTNEFFVQFVAPEGDFAWQEVSASSQFRERMLFPVKHLEYIKKTLGPAPMEVLTVCLSGSGYPMGTLSCNIRIGNGIEGIHRFLNAYTAHEWSRDQLPLAILENLDLPQYCRKVGDYIYTLKQ